MNVGSIENYCKHGTISQYFELAPDSPWVPLLCANYGGLLSSLDNLTDSTHISNQVSRMYSFWLYKKLSIRTIVLDDNT